jgi:hypothetical protein
MVKVLCKILAKPAAANEYEKFQTHLRSIQTDLSQTDGLSSQKRATLLHQRDAAQKAISDWYTKNKILVMKEIGPDLKGITDRPWYPKLKGLVKESFLDLIEKGEMDLDLLYKSLQCNNPMDRYIVYEPSPNFGKSPAKRVVELSDYKGKEYLIKDDKLPSSTDNLKEHSSFRLGLPRQVIS